MTWTGVGRVPLPVGMEQVFAGGARSGAHWCVVECK